MKNKKNEVVIPSLKEKCEEKYYNLEGYNKISLKLKKLGFKDVSIDETEKLTNVKLVDLLDDDLDQIIISDELFNAFNMILKDKKYYSKKEVKRLFQHVIFLYNDTQSEDKLGALTYIERITNLLDYIDCLSIMELSIEQLNQLLELEDDSLIEKTYKEIKRKRHKLSQKEFSLFMKMLKNTKSKIDTKEAKEVYKYISYIYNENTILQDNVDYMKYLETFAKINIKSIFNMRMYQILELFKIENINYENINEQKKLINDLTYNNA